MSLKSIQHLWGNFSSLTCSAFCNSAKHKGNILSEHSRAIFRSQPYQLWAHESARCIATFQRHQLDRVLNNTRSSSLQRGIVIFHSSQFSPRKFLCAFPRTFSYTCITKCLNLQQLTITSQRNYHTRCVCQVQNCSSTLFPQSMTHLGFSRSFSNSSKDGEQNSEEAMCTEKDSDPTHSSLKEELMGDQDLDAASETMDEKPAKSSHVLSENTDADLENTPEVEDYSYFEVAEDIEEYEYKLDGNVASHEVRAEKEPIVSLERGSEGVFDLEELLTVLEELGAEDVVTIPIPPEANFCQHMVVASAKSQRHMKAINEEMLWIHKRKKSAEDKQLKIEGLEAGKWSAMDLGNLVLHVFLGSTREYYDLESLWTLGPDHDPKCQGEHQDAYALSAEDLFWLEAGNAGAGSEEASVRDGDPSTQDGDPSSQYGDPSSQDDGPATSQGEATQRFTEQDAGWNEEVLTKPSSSSKR